MKIIYITAQTPLGKGETFILEELFELKSQEVDLLIIPRNPTRNIFHKEAEGLIKDSICLPLINGKIFIKFLFSLITKVQIVKVTRDVFKYSKNIHILIKNLIVLPKAVYISDIVKNNNIKHIHVHWGSTTSTIGYIVSKLSGVSWSLTLHRWDIKENNMLKEKAKSAKFIRCISENGKAELLKIIGADFKDKIKVIHMGIKIPFNKAKIYYEDKKIFKIIVPANLLPVKGHKYLIEACSILVKKNIKNFKCIFYGEGLTRKELEKLINRKSLESYIEMPGFIPHEKLILMYKNKEIDIVILPSINTKNGEHEGIPVALMEAMAHFIPAISTNTGGIPELLSGGAGVIVEEKNSKQLAVAIKNLMTDKSLRKKIRDEGYKKANKEYSVKKNVIKLIELFELYS